METLKTTKCTSCKEADVRLAPNHETDPKKTYLCNPCIEKRHLQAAGTSGATTHQEPLCIGVSFTCSPCQVVDPDPQQYVRAPELGAEGRRRCGFCNENLQSAMPNQYAEWARKEAADSPCIGCKEPVDSYQGTGTPNVGYLHGACYDRYNYAVTSNRLKSGKTPLPFELPQEYLRDVPDIIRDRPWVLSKLKNRLLKRVSDSPRNRINHTENLKLTSPSFCITIRIRELVQEVLSEILILGKHQIRLGFRGLW